MMNQQQFIESQKDCADMLGMSLSEYEDFCKNIKIIPSDNKEISKYDNSILYELGLCEKDLKTR